MNNQTGGRCIICGSELDEGASFCPGHARAEKNIRDGYDAWNRAYGTIRLEDYLARLVKLSETGDRVKELVQFYQSNMDKWKKETA